jgi:hypothetical protein
MLYNDNNKHEEDDEMIPFLVSLQSQPFDKSFCFRINAIYNAYTFTFDSL